MEPKTKYRLIAEQLARDIGRGRFPVDSYLPTESSLMRSYGVSRHTIRAAVQDLRARGMVSSRQGQGTRVISTSERSAFAETIQSIDELITFGQETRRIPLGSDIVEADEELAELFGCRPGRRIARVRLLRKTREPDERTIAVATLWMDALLEPVIGDLGKAQESAAEIIRRRFGFRTGHVVQTIQAGSVPAADARELGARPGEPALLVTRVYSASPDAEPFLVARSLCRADAFRVVSRFTSSKRG